MVQGLTSFVAWFQTSITVLLLIVGFVSYQQPQFHNTRTLVALMSLVFLALTQVFLVLAQALLIIPTRPLSYDLFTALFGCCMLIYLSEFLFRKLQGRGWNITRGCVAILYLAFTIIVVLGYVHNLS